MSSKATREEECMKFIQAVKPFLSEKGQRWYQFFDSQTLKPEEKASLEEFYNRVHQPRSAPPSAIKASGAGVTYSPGQVSMARADATGGARSRGTSRAVSIVMPLMPVTMRPFPRLNEQNFLENPSDSPEVEPDNQVKQYSLKDLVTESGKKLDLTISFAINGFLDESELSDQAIRVSISTAMDLGSSDHGQATGEMDEEIELLSEPSEDEHGGYVEIQCHN